MTAKEYAREKMLACENQFNYFNEIPACILKTRELKKYGINEVRKECNKNGYIILPLEKTLYSKFRLMDRMVLINRQVHIITNLKKTHRLSDIGLSLKAN